MFFVNVNFRNPVLNIGGIGIRRIPDLGMIIDCLTLLRASTNTYSSFMGERSSIDHLEARVIETITMVRDYVASYFVKERSPIVPKRPTFDLVACEEPIVKNAFYNKNMCTAHQVSATESTSRKSMAKYDFSGPGVFAKLENSNRCTLDGHEEQVVVMCNQHGHTNSTMPRPGINVVKDVYSRLDKCVDKFLDELLK